MLGEGVSCGVSANKYSCTHGAQINFRDLTPYLTNELFPLSNEQAQCHCRCKVFKNFVFTEGFYLELISYVFDKLNLVVQLGLNIIC
jgi:hypothetical protein